MILSFLDSCMKVTHYSHMIFVCPSIVTVSDPPPPVQGRRQQERLSFPPFHNNVTELFPHS